MCKMGDTAKCCMGDTGRGGGGEKLFLIFGKTASQVCVGDIVKGVMNEVKAKTWGGRGKG